MRLVLFALSALLAVDQATPQRDRPVPRAAAGIVRGRVVSASTGAPLHRVQITLSGGTQPVAPAVTNTRGEFEVTGVSAGSYTATAKRLGYLTTQYGQRGSDRGRPIIVAENEIVPKIDFALVRGGVLAGVITDDVGTEYAGVRVDALEMKFVRGRRIPVTAATTTSDDRGQYRLSGLAPGAYLIRASTTDTWTAEAGRSYAFASTYYPGVTAFSDSETLTLPAAHELSNLNFGLRAGRSARIVGTYQSPDAQVGGQQIHLSRITRTIGNSVLSSGDAGTTRTNQEGAFEFRSLPPGEYVVSTGASDKDRGAVTLVLTDGDERSVVIGPRQPTAIAGTVRVVSDQQPRFALRLRVISIAADPDYLPPSSFTSPAATVGPDFSFRYPDLVGPMLFRVEGLPDDWMVSAVTMNGNDVTDVPVEFGPGHSAGPLQITITDKAATVTGHVIAAANVPAADSTIVVFSADPSRWTSSSRYIKIARPRSDGQFVVGGLVPGRYLAVAGLTVAEGQWEDPLFLKSLADSATAFDVRIEEPAIIELKVERAQ